jgi:microsomal epoxide hydrolase
MIALPAQLVSACHAQSAARPASRSALPPIVSHRFRTSDGVSLHMLKASPARISAQAPVLAFVPGWSMPAAIWSAQLRSLGARHRCAALDPRGQGESEVPAHGYTLQRRTDDIAEFVARYPKVVLIGWSLGALECLQYVHLYGEDRIAGLVLVDSSVGEQPPPAEGNFTESLKGDRAKVVEAFVRAIFRSKRPPEQIQQLVAGALRLPAQASIDLLSYPPPREHWRDIAWAFRKPLLYVVTPQFAAQASNLQRNRPGTRIELFERAGHALFVDEPERFNTLIEDFVQSLPGL